MANPSVARPRTPASLLRAGLAARALGVRLHRAVDHRLRGLHGPADDRDARLLVHQHQPRPGRAAPVRRAEELRALLARPAGLGIARDHAQVRGHRAAGGGDPAVPRRAAAPLAAPVGDGRVPGPVLPALRRARSWRACSSGAGCSTRHRLDQRRRCRRSASSNPPPWLEDPGWVYPGLALIGVWGIGAGMIVYLAGLKGIPTDLYEAAKIDGAGAWAIAPPHHHPDADAGHLLHDRARRSSR